MEVRGFQVNTENWPRLNLIRKFDEGLILAQDERWRRALRMQVARTFGLVADG